MQKFFEFSLPSLHVGRFSPCFSDRCGRLSVSISLARPAVAGGLQILLPVYRAAVAEAFRFIVGCVEPAVAGGSQVRRCGESPTLDFLFRSGRFLYPPPPSWTVSYGETIDRRLRCGRYLDGSVPPLRKTPSSRPPIYFPPTPEVCFEPYSPLRVIEW